MRILLLDQFSDAGGAQRCLMDLLPEIQRRGWEPHLMAPGNGPLLEWSRCAGIPTYSLPMNGYSNGGKTARDLLRFSLDAPRMVQAIREVVCRHDIELIYVNGPRALPAVIGARCPVVFHSHNHVTGSPSQKLLRWALRRTGATVIAASDFVARSYRNVRPGLRPHVIYNGVEDHGREVRDFSRRPARIGLIGRIAPEKGHLDFLRAAAVLAKDRIPPAQFFVYGDRLFSDAGYDRTVRALAEHAPVQLCGWANNVPEVLRGLDILAVPSGAAEASPRVILEAFSACTPVVAYRSGGIPEIIEDGRTGVLTDASRFESLADSIRSLLSDPDRMRRLSIAGRHEWQRRFTVQLFRQNICEVIETCTSCAARPRAMAGVSSRT
jgi:glycosyltransferase involved in cell wall biosynthesis